MMLLNYEFQVWNHKFHLSLLLNVLLRSVGSAGHKFQVLLGATIVFNFSFLRDKLPQSTTDVNNETNFLFD